MDDLPAWFRFCVSCYILYTLYITYIYIHYFYYIYIYMFIFDLWVDESHITQPHVLKCGLELEYSQNHQNILLRSFYFAQIYQHQSTSGKGGLVQSLS